MRGHSLVELTEHDNIATDFMVHMMYIYVLLHSSYVICTSTVVVTICIYSTTADDMYVCIVCAAIKLSIDQPRKVAKPARGQLNREMKCPCRCIRGKSVCTAVCICLRVHVHLCTVCCTNKQT